MKQHWREPKYWLWLWRQGAPTELKGGVAVLALAALVAGGWLAADRLTSAHATVTATKPFVFQTTTRKVVTVHEQGKVVRKLVPVVKTVKVTRRGEAAYRTRVQYSTRVVTTPGQLRTVRKLVPVVKSRVVTVNGGPRTLVTTRLVPTTLTETAVQTQTVTNTQNVTVPPSTVTTSRTSTVTQTQTQTVTQILTTTVTVTTTLERK